MKVVKFFSLMLGVVLTFSLQSFNISPNADSAVWLLQDDGEWVYIEGVACVDIGLAAPPTSNFDLCRDVASVGAPDGVTQGNAADDFEIRVKDGDRQLWMLNDAGQWVFLATIYNANITEGDISVYLSA